jgi:hypothetical protein
MAAKILLPACLRTYSLLCVGDQDKISGLLSHVPIEQYQHPICQAFLVPVGHLLHWEGHTLPLQIWDTLNVHASSQSGEVPLVLCLTSPNQS